MEPDQKSINDVYTRMEAEGWDTSQSLQWRFFFFSTNEKNLRDIYSSLVAHDYKVEELYENEDGDWLLQLSKFEVLPAEQLFQRCLSFKKLAEQYNAYYDGWDVVKNTL